MYIMFPIGWMYYFGTNLDNKFSVKDFWPSKEQLNKIPTERDDIAQEVERMKKQRLRKREARLAEHKFEEDDASSIGRPVSSVLNDRSLGGPLDQFANSGSDREGRGWLDWAKGRS
jgi:protein PET100